MSSFSQLINFIASPSSFSDRTHPCIVNLLHRYYKSHFTNVVKSKLLYTQCRFIAACLSNIKLYFKQNPYVSSGLWHCSVGFGNLVCVNSIKSVVKVNVGVSQYHVINNNQWTLSVKCHVININQLSLSVKMSCDKHQSIGTECSRVSAGHVTN